MVLVPSGSPILDHGSGGLLQATLLAWYRGSARPLRIRTTRDPWAILVAEIMAQQTQISRVDEAWAAFLERFPTPRALAQASTAEVLRAWAGLGYNRRAVNLQRAARSIEVEHGGRVPDDMAALQRLPGVGPYTARAVAAQAFGRPVAAVDTNVRRVIARLLGRTPGDRDLQALADRLVVRDQAATWAQAIMELGATDLPVEPARLRGLPAVELVRQRRQGGGQPARRSRPRRPHGRSGPPPRPCPSSAPRAGFAVASWPDLRDVQDGAWTQLPESLGEHGPEQVAAAVGALCRDGLLERHADGSVRLPSEAS